MNETDPDYIAYTKGARTPEARAAKAKYMRTLRAAHRQAARRFGHNPIPGITHGRSGYKDQYCRCTVCCDANSTYEREHPRHHRDRRDHTRADHQEVEH